MSYSYAPQGLKYAWDLIDGQCVAVFPDGQIIASRLGEDARNITEAELGEMIERDAE